MINLNNPRHVYALFFIAIVVFIILMVGYPLYVALGG